MPDDPVTGVTTSGISSSQTDAPAGPSSSPPGSPGGVATSLVPGNGSTVGGGDPAYGSGAGGGIEQQCAADYRQRFEGGREWFYGPSGASVREVRMNFNEPTANDDNRDSLRFTGGSRWVHEDGRVWVCTDATEGAAVWELQASGDAAAAAASAASAASDAAAAAASAIAAAATNASVLTSTTSNTLGTGVSKTWTYGTQSNLSWRVGDRLKIFRTSAPTYYVIGPVTAVSTTSVSVTPDIQLNNGTFTDWTIQLVHAGGVLSFPGAGSGSERFGNLSLAAGSSASAFGFTSSASGSSSSAFGAYSLASGANSTAWGFGATGSNTYTIAGGSGCLVSGSGSLGIGMLLTVSGANSVGIGGYDLDVTGSNSIGINASCFFAQGVCIGQGIIQVASITQSTLVGQGIVADGGKVSGGEIACVGQGSVMSAWRGTGLGWQVEVSAVSGTAIGRGSVVRTPHGLAIGRGSYVPPASSDMATTNAVTIGLGGDATPMNVGFDNWWASHYTAQSSDATVYARTAASCPVTINGQAGHHYTRQVETATVVGTITVAGNAKATVTSPLVTGSPLAIYAAVLVGDTASVVAAKLRYAVANNSYVSPHYFVGSAGAALSLQTLVYAADDPTLNIAIANDTCAGLTAAPTSSNTVAGGGATANLSGGAIYLAGGQGSGTGVGGETGLLVSLAGSSGTAKNPLVGVFLAHPISGLKVYRTITAAGTTSTQQINKPAGVVNAAPGATSVTVNNTMVDVNSIIVPSIRSNDLTAQVKNYVASSGSFTINFVAAVNAETSVGFIVYN